MRVSIAIAAFIFFFAVTSIILGSYAIISRSSERIFKGEGKIYDTSFGSVLCASFERTQCGIVLSSCHDGATYACMLNVRERGE